jgi:hypothetical protein
MSASATRRRSARFKVASMLCSILILNGCGLEEIEIPDLLGPAGLGLNVRLTATPDIITADGFSTSVVQATVRDQNGRPVSGREFFFSVADEDGRAADIGTLRSPATSTGVGTGLVVRTNAQGIAQVVYEAPPRTDATANQIVLVSVRPVGTDASGATASTVGIELRSAEPRLFPQVPGNLDPECDFTVEAPSGFRANQSILFQSTSFDTDGTIVRYFWDFGNGRRADSPDGATSYRLPGDYTVTHIVTDDDGGEQGCQGAFTIQ